MSHYYLIINEGLYLAKIDKDSNTWTSELGGAKEFDEYPKEEIKKIRETMSAAKVLRLTIEEVG